MRSLPKFRTAAQVIAAVAVGVLSATGATAAQAAPDTSPAITADPSTGLVDGQQITVTGTGFEPSEVVYTFQCGTLNALSGCTAEMLSVVTDTNGNFTTPFTARSSFTVVNHNGDPIGTIDCTTRPTSCQIGAAADEMRYAGTPVSFG